MLTRLDLYIGEDLALNALNGAAQHLDAIRGLIANAESQWRNDGDFEGAEGLPINTNALIWLIRSFFWELFAVSDMILQWTNTTYGLGIKESQVRWADLKKRESPLHRDLWRQLRDVIATYRESADFFEIETYRHFSHTSVLHLKTILSRDKRFVFVALESARVGQAITDVREQLGTYVEFMKRFGTDVFLSELQSSSSFQRPTTRPSLKP